MIEQASDTLYNCRIQLIEKWFKIVLENIVDDKIKINNNLQIIKKLLKNAL